MSPPPPAAGGHCGPELQPSGRRLSPRLRDSLIVLAVAAAMWDDSSRGEKRGSSHPDVGEEPPVPSGPVQLVPADTFPAPV